MGIIVVDQSPELFWYVSNALIQDDIALKQVQTIETAKRIILHELPEVVILNGDDKGSLTDTFIQQMRNSVFARHTVFIVFTSNTDPEFKKSLLMAGATQIFYRGQGFGPSLKFFSQFIKWCLSYKNPKDNLFEYKPHPFEAQAHLTTYARVGWISQKHCLIETNMSLNSGEIIDVSSPLFDELKLKNIKLKCIEKDKTGRYYQYAHTLLCEILSPNPEIDAGKIETWIKNNAVISKDKSIKLVYFDNSPEYREVVRQMIKSHKSYCARGYNSLKDISEILTHQLPHLILVNRSLLQSQRQSFEKIKKFIKNNFAFCITYNTEKIESEKEIEKFKKDFNFAMHVPSTVDLELLESMIVKLKEKLPTEHDSVEKIFFNKHSPYSRLSLECDIKITELAINGLGAILPFEINSFSSCVISCNNFTIEGLDRKQFFRTFNFQKTSTGMYHRMIFMGQSIKDNELVKKLIEKESNS